MSHFVPFSHNYKMRKLHSNKCHVLRTEMIHAAAIFLYTNYRNNIGDYFEFGCHGAKTFRQTFDIFETYFKNVHYHAFDSFEGLPEIKGLDKNQSVWKQGQLKTPVNTFERIISKHGFKKNQFTIVPGFFDASLTPELTKKWTGKKASLIHIDCDLYESTVPVLKFIKPFLKKGTVIVFDDWTCFEADPELGEKKAFREFRQANPTIHFEPFLSNPLQSAFIAFPPND